jgi:hypothetical protein
MKKSTKLFLALLVFVLANVALSLSLTFTVPPGTDPFEWFKQAHVQLGLFVATGLVILVLNFWLVFGYMEPVPFFPPLTPGALYGFMTPLLFFSLYFVRRPTLAPTTQGITFFDLIPMTFISLVFFLALTIINVIADNVHAVKRGVIEL